MLFLLGLTIRERTKTGKPDIRSFAVGLTVSQGHLRLPQARSLFEWEYTISYSKLPFVFRARNPPLRRANVRLSVPTNELSPRYTSYCVRWD